MVRQETPSGGMHVFFRWDQRLDGISNRACLLTRGGCRRHGLEAKLHGALLTFRPATMAGAATAGSEEARRSISRCRKRPTGCSSLYLTHPCSGGGIELLRRARDGRRHRYRNGRPNRRLAADARALVRSLARLPIGRQQRDANGMPYGFGVRHGPEAQHYAADFVAAVLALPVDRARGPWTGNQAERLVDDALSAGSRHYVRK